MIVDTSRLIPPVHLGFKHVVINGKPAIQDGAMTSARPGRVLYGPAKK